MRTISLFAIILAFASTVRGDLLENGESCKEECEGNFLAGAFSAPCSDCESTTCVKEWSMAEEHYKYRCGGSGGGMRAGLRKDQHGGSPPSIPDGYSCGFPCKPKFDPGQYVVDCDACASGECLKLQTLYGTWKYECAVRGSSDSETLAPV